MLKVASPFRLTWPKTREMLNMLNMLNVSPEIGPSRLIAQKTFNMFNMFNISRVLGHVKRKGEATFNISRVLSDFRLTCLTFPRF